MLLHGVNKHWVGQRRKQNVEKYGARKFNLESNLKPGVESEEEQKSDNPI